MNGNTKTVYMSHFGKDTLSKHEVVFVLEKFDLHFIPLLYFQFQTCGMGILIACIGQKHAIIVGLALEACQLALLGFFSAPWILWTAGSIAGLGSITYPALSAFLSNHVKSDQQGLTQGLLTGIRGLCGGLGPAVYGLIFFIFQVNLNSQSANDAVMDDAPISLANGASLPGVDGSFQAKLQSLHRAFIPGPPFAFGSLLALLAILTAMFIPNETPVYHGLPISSSKSRRGQSAGSTSESIVNLLGDESDLEGGEGNSTSSYGSAFAFSSTERRRHKESRHQRQSSASKNPRQHPPSISVAPLATKLANPLRRILQLSSSRQRSHSPPPTAAAQPRSATGASHFLGVSDPVTIDTRETAAADLANFRVPYRLSEAVIGDAAATATAAAIPLLPHSTTTTTTTNGGFSNSIGERVKVIGDPVAMIHRWQISPPALQLTELYALLALDYLFPFRRDWMFLLCFAMGKSSHQMSTQQL
ncbi:hypothetical protein ACTXT7_015622 [Hymenolepis weldensis]